MNSLTRIFRLIAAITASAAVGLLAALLSANPADLFALAASLFVLVIAATDYGSTARRIQRMRRTAPVLCASRSDQRFQLAA